MSIELFLVIALILFVSSVLQSAIGFGYGLLAIPLIVWMDVGLPSAIAIVAVTTSFQMAWGCWSLRADLAWGPAMPIIGFRLLGLPVGILLLRLLVDQVSSNQIKQFVGIMLLVAIVIQFAFRVTPRPRIPMGWTALAGVSSGVLNGLVNMGGPPLVLWLMAHDWSTRKSRSFIWLVTLIVTPIMLLMFAQQFGMPVVMSMLHALIFVPAVFAGTMAGLRVGHLMSRQKLRVASVVVLVIIAIASIVEPML